MILAIAKKWHEYSTPGDVFMEIKVEDHFEKYKQSNLSDGETILDIIEELGMLPPPKKIIQDDPEQFPQFYSVINPVWEEE